MSESFTPGQDRVFYTKAVFGEEEIQAVMDCLKTGWLGPGALSEQFEQKIAALFGKKYGLFVNSGSSANIIAMDIANLPPGSEVITQACTFPATLNPILMRGHVPVFVDSVVGNYNIDVDKIEDAISEKTKAIYISHTVGNINDMKRIREICDRHNLIFIEDSCDTHGSLFEEKPPGEWSDITTTSFYASHNITAGGGGGMVMVNDESLIKDAKVFRDWGRALPENADEDVDERFGFTLNNVPYDGKFYHTKIAYNFKPVEMQAAFGLAQLEKLPTFNETRKRNIAHLRERLAKHTDHFILPESHPDATVYWLAFPVSIKKDSPIKRKELLVHLEKNKIQTRLLFTGNILYHEPYQNIEKRVHGTLDGADYILENTFLLGCHHGLTEEMVDYVMDTVDSFIANL